MCLFRKLAGKTLFITGASRGIGKSIALKAAKDGANIVIAAKTATPHPKLPGTIYTAAKESKLGSKDMIEVQCSPSPLITYLIITWIWIQHNHLWFQNVFIM